MPASKKNLLMGSLLASAFGFAVSASLFFSDVLFPHHKTMSPDDISVLTPYTSRVDKTVDYTSMTWQEAIKFVKTPDQAQDYITRHLTVDVDSDEPVVSFAKNHSLRYGRPTDKANAASALLSDDGYTPNELLLRNASLIGFPTAVYLYRTPSGFGTLGSPRISPKHETVDGVVNDITRIAQRNFNFVRFDSWLIADYERTYPDSAWMVGDKFLYNRIHLLDDLLNFQDVADK
jgi:hypothetical protein